MHQLGWRITTWNLEWFPNGSARETTPEKQAQRIQAAVDVLKELNPDILLLQEVRDYDACNRLGEAIQRGAALISTGVTGNSNQFACNIASFRKIKVAPVFG